MLDPDYIQRAAPPGSMRYFALLYTPPEQREMLTALFVIDAEIRATVSAAHEVAHTRLQWWRGEIDRLVNRSAQHPATKILQAALPRTDFIPLHELLVAADMDLARMTYNNSSELTGYLDRSGGALFEVAANVEARAGIRTIGRLIRRVETLRDVAADLRAGHIYWPLDALSAGGLEPERLGDLTHRAGLERLIAGEAQKIDSELRTVYLPEQSQGRTNLARPLAVLAALHLRIASYIARNPASVFTRRHELGALQKVWTAWRAARRS